MNRHEDIQSKDLKSMAEYLKVLAYCKMRDDRYEPCPYLGTDHSCQQCWEDYLAEEVNDGNSSCGK